ncbi:MULTISPECIES: S9 family peptidase [unclassified Janthinobacterium]|uniref:alpha/beta hydrolase family protein n=1 Tax=unclassified Janthinobacterium TaxID=2610881 RepID=UPI0017F5552D|nr:MULTISPECIES: prolyl oligopeptidase family serine peptidase [unclassified Janthinobacterium]MBB5370712.1 dipeptidyl aminopeptidase/acylaminoacyl peptidase [Janthinobacterium sp. K2C7]MBB5383518.1 dipeptidyl aminopeptidase/acylaminoacyl peptidase [Janthinobacterium sp. K2Li3]MBB5388972.1 dipeptidyl aminopeptidase/acylaminoacyl peptidase [Janthinobacterium sp. K2E3]
MSTRSPLPLLPITVGLLASSSMAMAQDSGYQLPPAPLQAIVDAPRAPTLSLSPKRNLAAVLPTPSLPSIREVAQPELKLAGLRINPRTYSSSRFSFYTGLGLLDIDTQKEIKVSGLPATPRIADLAWSPDQHYLAFTHIAYADPAKGVKESGVELWLLDVQTKVARKLGSQPLSAVYGRGFSWLPDSKTLLVQLKPAKLGAAPQPSGIPTGPATQDSNPGGGVKQLRTYPDLLKNEEDAKLFEHYITVQLALLDVTGKQRLVGQPGQFSRVSSSPDGKNLLTTSIVRPYSYIVPAYDFGHKIEVRDLAGKVTHTVATLPLEEGLPPGNDAVSVGVRDVTWRVDAPATLVWAEAQDGGDPAKAADIRDIVYTQAAPFTVKPAVLAKLASRYLGVAWGRGDLALLTEGWYKTRVVKQWKITPDQPATPAELLSSRSLEDRYNDPGQPVMRADAAGLPRLLIAADNSILLDGQGASSEGDRPFIDRFNLTTKKTERLFQSTAPYYENVVAVLDEDGSRLLSTREAPTEQPNYYVRNLKQQGAAQLTALTHFPHPLPQLKEVQKELIRYKRADGVDLTATLMLPPGYDVKRDGPLPTLMWAYPQEFKSASAASQTKGSPFKFNAVSYWGPAAFLSMGYAVLDNPSFPIVGNGEQEPNDTYLTQLVADAEAAVNEVVKRGVSDRNRIAIGGHSYGAFMTGNLLAHTRLFRAGIARSGAYNRTLTPFGFQAEDRSFWKAQDVYQAMSPFNYADKIKDALLMIHGEQDNNSGTFPIQSERMFQAVKGLGGTARLVMLPNESHAYRARESIMQMLYESNNWLEKYVKNAKPTETEVRQAVK